MSVFVEEHRDDDLEHYGVLGMKWGVRKNPDRAYRKSISQLSSLDKKRETSEIKGAKLDAKSAKKYETKAAKYESKAAKKSVRTSRLEMKARRLRMKASSAWTAGGHRRRIRKAEKLEFKSSKGEFKAAKYSDKAKRAARKAADLNAGAAGKNVRALRYEKKAKKWATEMNKAFADIPLNALEPGDIRIGEAYGVTFINEYMKRSS